MSEMWTISVEEVAPSPYAGFWRRTGAFAIDFLVLTPVIILLNWIFGTDIFSEGGEAPPSVLRLFLVGSIYWIYFAGMESSAHQATLGGKALGMLVADLKGRRISFGAATLRNWVIWAIPVASAVDIVFGLDAVFQGLGLLQLPILIAAIVSAGMVAFTARKQGWHDMMASTLVVRERAKFQTPAADGPTAPP